MGRKPVNKEERAQLKYLPFKKGHSYLIGHKETGKVGKIRVMHYDEKFCYYCRNEDVEIKKLSSEKFYKLFFIVLEGVDDLIIRDYDVQEEIKKRERNMK